MNRGFSAASLNPCQPSLETASAFFSPSTIRIGRDVPDSIAGDTQGGKYSRCGLPGATRYLAFSLTFPSTVSKYGLSRLNTYKMGLPSWKHGKTIPE